MINKVILVGRVGKDAETTGIENNVAKFSVATSERYTDKNGEKQENTEWHNVVAFGKLAEIISKYVVKGMQIYVEGKIQTQEYEKEGQKRYSTQIIARDVKFLSKAQSEVAQTQDSEEYHNDDLPF